MSAGKGRRQALDEWFGTPAGSAVWAREQAVIRCLLEECFGHHGLEVGTPSAAPMLLADCTLGHRIRLDVDAGGRLGGAFGGDLHSLPLRPRTVAAAVLVHVLDYHPAPGSVLAAVEQSLAPGALLVVSVFNPWHPQVVHAQFTANAPWAPANRCGARRCRHWLQALHLEVRRPVYTTAGGWSRGGTTWERFASTLPLGAGYVIAARKREREHLAIPMGARLSRRLPASGMPRPTNRNMKDTAA